MSKENKSIKMQPQSIEAEKAVLGCMLIDPDAVPRALHLLNEDSFFNQNIPIIDKTIEITLEQSYTGISVPIIVDKWRLENNTKIFY